MFKDRFFYNKSIRRYVVLFAALFNDMLIKRDNHPAPFKVPIAYMMKEKFIAALENRNGVNGSEGTPELETVLPRMSFYMSDLFYDKQRKVNLTQIGVNTVRNPEGLLINQKQLAPVAYTFVMDLSIYTRYEDDMLQIVEQILPYFQPHFTAKIKEPTVTGVDDRDIYINLLSIEPAEQVIGLMNDGRRIVQWDLKFELYGYLYPHIQETKQIKRTIVNFVGELKELLDDDAAIFRATDEVDPFDAQEDGVWTIKSTREYPREGT